MNDPEVYEDPEVFRPERFIRDGALDTSVRDPAAFVFGYGRRHVAAVYLRLFGHTKLTRYPGSALGVTLPKTRCSLTSLAYCTPSTSGHLSGKMAVL